MKKILILWLLLFPVFGFAYQQQWFSQFQENFWSTDFLCESQCFAIMWATDEYDMLNIDGQINGQWILGYWFLVWQQVVPWEIIQINWNVTINQKFIFSKSQVFSQIPKNSQIVLIMEGGLKGKIDPKLDFLSLWEKISIAWKDFWEMETLTPYSINLRYWVKILWTSILQYWYRIFILIAAYILIFSKWHKQQKYQKIFFCGIGIFLFIGIRNFITYTWIVDQWIKNFSQQTADNKTFFDLGDYIALTDKIRKQLHLDDKNKICTIKIYSFQDRPFKAHRENLYIKPCISIATWSQADYILYYKKPINEEDSQKPVLLDFNGSYLLQNK